ncbi:ATP-dependent zinc metalloprotease FtsH [Pilimelia terevasa]|uniref:ATP-dependent zinc metalloprotease FtsH n=1 Tax=Pilimelia terevasa TaxID=53372 RepID=A0A8J3FDW8_9ACTN|nr:ATP-dependent zinc metalloprotease FtsH [Pilimelia terevasa]GGK11758.1 ATP-dependent zinc metalloprotease FtsH [Pilimelia terevasa]
MERTRFFRRPVVWIILVIVGAVLLSSFLTSGPSYHEVTTSQMQDKLSTAQVKKALIQDKEQVVQLDLEAEATYGKVKTTRIQAHYPSGAASDIFHKVEDAGKAGRVKEWDTQRSEDSILVSLLLNLLPIVFLVLLLFFFMSQMQGGGSRVLNFGKSKAKMVSKDMPKTTFADVAGADEAVEELHEIKDFLQNPAKYQALGAKIPKGVLLFGPPGTGKTLLARAVAGEAGVPFYSISGSDFVEMFVGVGASRVRDLFEQAKSNAPAIVFVDEIDAVGRHRGAGMGGGHDEREQTLNQLLVEMDGFDAKGGVILIAATNRPDILDPALLRPGRFDRQIAVDSPDMEGRKAILRVHSKGKPFTPDVDLDSVARRTPGFTGADLANVINEAALLAARNDKRAIGNEFLEESIDRVVAGPQRRSRVMSENEKRITAYHEGGHALVAWALPHSAPVHKVTILSRGRSLGHTLVLPTEDKYTQTRAEMIDTLAYALGGRAAEELVFHEPTTGAGNDIEKATNLARAMITQYGMSSKLGAIKYGTTGDEPFLGRTYGHERDYSDAVAAEIDAEVRGLIELAHDEAWEILVEYRDVLDDIVVELMEKETISTADMARICERVAKRPPMAPYSGNGKRKRSTLPPVAIPAATAEDAEARAADPETRIAEPPSLPTEPGAGSGPVGPSGTEGLS